VARDFAESGWGTYFSDLDPPEFFTKHPKRMYRGIILDPCPDGQPRLEHLRVAREHAPSAYILAVTAYPSVSLAVASLRAGANDFLVTPVSPAEIISRLTSSPSVSELHELPSLARIQAEYIARVLLHTGGNISAAARVLGVRRSTLQRKLKKYPAQR
jgi:two-component system response regulator RegA